MVFVGKSRVKQFLSHILYDIFLLVCCLSDCGLDEGILLLTLLMVLTTKFLLSFIIDTNPQSLLQWIVVWNFPQSKTAAKYWRINTRSSIEVTIFYHK